MKTRMLRMDEPIAAGDEWQTVEIDKAAFESIPVAERKAFVDGLAVSWNPVPDRVVGITRRQFAKNRNVHAPQVRRVSI